MAFFHKYPYDSAHELNLDWLIANMKTLIEIYDKLPEDLQSFVDAWLDAHPEATTTVQDGSLTPPKLLASAPEDGQVLSYNGSGFEWIDDALGGKWKIIQVDCGVRAASTIILNEDGEFLVIDFGDANSGLAIASAITGNGGNVCKGVIISHFHADHCGGYRTVFENVNISLADDAVAYIQKPYPASWSISQTTRDLYDNFVAYFEGLGGSVVVPDPDIEYSIMGLPVKFYNTSYDHIDPVNDTEYFNNASLCNTIRIGCMTLGCWGDIYFESEKNIVETEAIGPCDIILAPHHGLSARIHRGFIEALDPKLILMNMGSTSAEQAGTFYNSAIRTYADETVKNIIDVDAGNVIVKVNGDGSFMIDGSPKFYPQIIRNYPSMRNAVNVRNVSVSQAASTGIKDLLLAMEPNSAATFYAIGSGNSPYQICVDFGINVTALFEIIKTTGGSTNMLNNRANPDNFMFTVKVKPLNVSGNAIEIVGFYNNGSWSVYRSTPDRFMFAFNVGTDGTITPRSGMPTSFSSRSGHITFPVGGYYIIHLCNTVSVNGTVTIGDFTSSTIYSHSATFTGRAFSAGEVACSSTGGTMTVLLECVKPELDLSVFA